ncbi:hypothetical protein [Alistipes shahii]|jgi:hypothetical protein|uniref:hypothetical protein n=1 Tax=Alistipes shahii TaxID=328814 RepID=UPI00266C5254|nr:hypothetical protein [Alistipes shahii]
MKKLWMIAGSALVMSACSDNVAEMNPAPAGNNDFVTLAEISASLPATRAYLEDVEFGAGKEVKTFWSSGDCITVWSEQEPERLLLYRLKSGADTPNAVFEVVGNEEGVHGTQFYALYNGSSSASKQITLNSVQNNNINRPSNNIAEGAAPMAAYAAVEDGNLSNVRFAFKNLCGIMAVTLTTDADAALGSITLNSTANLTGSGEVRFVNGEPSFRIGANAGKSISRELGNYKVKGGEPNTFYFVVPAQSYGYLALDVMSSTNPKPVWSRTRTIADGLSVGAGSITRIANVTVKTAAPHVYVEGDLYPNGATGDAVKGIVYEVAEDGLSGKMIYPRVLGTAKWTTLGADGDIPLSENGELNMEKAKKNIDAFPAFKLCADLPAVDNQSWYMPSRSELEALIPSINVINSSYKTLKGDDAGSLIPLNTETSVRNWSSTGYVAPNNAVRAYTARYSYTIDEETDEDISEWKISGSSVSSAYNVLAITKFKSK